MTEQYQDGQGLTRRRRRSFVLALALAYLLGSVFVITASIPNLTVVAKALRSAGLPLGRGSFGHVIPRMLEVDISTCIDTPILGATYPIMASVSYSSFHYNTGFFFPLRETTVHRLDVDHSPDVGPSEAINACARQRFLDEAGRTQALQRSTLNLLHPAMAVESTRPLPLGYLGDALAMLSVVLIVISFVSMARSKVQRRLPAPTST